MGHFATAVFAMIEKIHRKRPNRWLARAFDPPYRTIITVTLLSLGFIYAFFRAFDGINMENHKLLKQVAELSIPDFSITILMVDYTDTTRGPLIQVYASIRNTGAPASILSNSWKLQISSNGQIKTGEFIIITNEGRHLCMIGGKEQRIIERSDDLSIRASKTIDRNGYSDGVLGFLFHDNIISQLAMSTSEITLSASDIKNKTYIGSTTMEYINSHRPSPFSSLSHPYPEIGCPPNALGTVASSRHTPCR